MDDNHKDQLIELAEFVLGAYVIVAELLAALPIAVSLPRFAVDADVTAPEALEAMQRARALIEDEPIPDLHKRAHDEIIVDWMLSFDLVGLAKEAGLSPWRADAIEAALLRISVTAQAVESGELDEWGDH